MTSIQVLLLFCIGLNHTWPDDMLSGDIEPNIHYLMHKRFIDQNDKTGEYTLTDKGRLAFNGIRSTAKGLLK